MIDAPQALVPRHDIRPYPVGQQQQTQAELRPKTLRTDAKQRIRFTEFFPTPLE